MYSMAATEMNALHLELQTLLSCPLFMQEATPSLPMGKETENYIRKTSVYNVLGGVLIPRGKTVFIDFAKETQITANELIRLVEENGNIVKTPDFDIKDIVKLFNNLGEKLRVCDTVILVYDKKIPVQWFVHRLLQYYHLNARYSTPLPVFIYTGDTEVGKLPASISSVFNKEYGKMFSKHNLQ